MSVLPHVFTTHQNVAFWNIAFCELIFFVKIKSILSSSCDPHDNDWVNSTKLDGWWIWINHVLTTSTPVGKNKPILNRNTSTLYHILLSFKHIFDLWFISALIWGCDYEEVVKTYLYFYSRGDGSIRTGNLIWQWLWQKSWQ